MSQSSLFLDAPPHATRVRNARIVGERAASDCAAKAERASNFNTAAARAWVLNHLDRHGPTSGEDLTDGIVAAGMAPHDLRALGPVFASLSREGRIVQYGNTLRRRGHGTAGGIIWRIVR